MKSKPILLGIYNLLDMPNVALDLGPFLAHFSVNRKALLALIYLPFSLQVWKRVGQEGRYWLPLKTTQKYPFVHFHDVRKRNTLFFQLFKMS